MTGLLRYARHKSVALHNNTAHGLANAHALVHYPSGAIYTLIPKNACSTLRYSLAIANKCIAGPEDWTWIHPNNGTFAATLSELVRAPYSFVVLRCPHARLASVFLDKIIDKTPELWLLYRLTRDGFDPDALTFRTFVSLLGDMDLLNANQHWRPQQDFLVYETYSRVFALERFGEVAPELQEKIGFTLKDARNLTSHGTDQSETIQTGAFADMPLADLAVLKRSGRLPAHRLLYDDSLSAEVAALYAGDMALYAKWLDPSRMSFPSLVPASG